jgi:hypothetical protein
MQAREPAARAAAVAVVALLMLLGNGPARAIDVPGDYPTIQQAIDAAGPVDTINVGPGNYAGFHIGPDKQDLTISGSWDGSTIVDGDWASPTIMVDGAGERPDLRVRLSYLTIGYGVPGVWCQSATLDLYACQLSWNSGGALCAAGTDVTARYCSFISNVDYFGSGTGVAAAFLGGSNVQMESCDFEWNQDWGSGSSSSVIYQDGGSGGYSYIGIDPSYAGATYEGRGMYLANGSYGVAWSQVRGRHSAGCGGGICIENSSANLYCDIWGCSSDDSGGVSRFSTRLPPSISATSLPTSARTWEAGPTSREAASRSTTRRSGAAQPASSAAASSRSTARST